MDFRIEKDTMGKVQVPAHVYWGAQTQRSIENFKIARDTNWMPLEIIREDSYHFAKEELSKLGFWDADFQQLEDELTKIAF